MDEMDDDLCEHCELGMDCCLEVSEALAKTLDDLQPLLAAKYPIGDVAVRHSVAQAMIYAAVDIYTEENPLGEDDLASLYSHVTFLIRGAQEACGSGLEPEEPSDLEDE